MFSIRYTGNIIDQRMSNGLLIHITLSCTSEPVFALTYQTAIGIGLGIFMISINIMYYLPMPGVPNLLHVRAAYDKLRLFEIHKMCLITAFLLAKLERTTPVCMYFQSLLK